jgi:type IV pilus biogenesis protein CpaD/CtpE
MNARIIFTLAAAVALVACGSLTRPTETEADFGISVASVRQAQTANPETLRNPSTETMTGVDPDYANKVLETMRESVSKPQDVSQPLVIQIGGQGQGGR